MTRPGIEPATSRSQGGRSIHSAIEVVSGHNITIGGHYLLKNKDRVVVILWGSLFFITPSHIKFSLKPLNQSVLNLLLIRYRNLHLLHCKTHKNSLFFLRWDKISSRYYWKSAFEDIVTFIKSCDTCQRKVSLKKAKKPLHSIPVPSEAFSQVGMDLIGPLEKTPEGISI